MDNEEELLRIDSEIKQIRDQIKASPIKGYLRTRLSSLELIRGRLLLRETWQRSKEMCEENKR